MLVYPLQTSLVSSTSSTSVTLVHLTTLAPAAVFRMPSKLVHCVPTIWSALYIELATVHGIPGRTSRSSFPHCWVAATLNAICVALAYAASITWLAVGSGETGYAFAVLVVMVKVVKVEVGRLLTGTAVKDGMSLSGKPVVTVELTEKVVVGRLSTGTAVKEGISLSGNPVVIVAFGISVFVAM